MKNDINLYRYISYERFLEMIITNKIAAVSPSKWVDQYEGCFFKYINSGKGKKTFTEFIQKKTRGNYNIEQTRVKLIEFFNLMNSQIYGICFSAAYNKELMWRANSANNKAIMICTSRDRIEELIQANDEDYLFTFNQVKYSEINEEWIERLFDRITFDDSSRFIYGAEDAFLIKRPDYSYEEEYRALGTYHDKTENGIIMLNIPVCNEFITGIMVHPLAKDSFIATVEEICKLKDI